MIEDTPPDAGVEFDAGPRDAEVPAPPEPRSDKIDLLLVVDNSRNLDLAHEMLAATVPYLLRRLTSPACVNGLGNVVAETPSATDECPVGVRDFAPLKDFHVAVISTSIGGHGADACSPTSSVWNPAQNDAAHLLSRAEDGSAVSTYASLGFLAWDPGQSKNPPGDSSTSELGTKLSGIVRGVGRAGCGFESQLESIYRFLVDPLPYASIVVTDSQAVPTGVDEVLLKQRADFLRPDSAVSVVLLSDENDCSILEGGEYFLAGQQIDGNGQIFHLPRARSECAANPDDPCCASCVQSAPTGCPPPEADPACALPPMDALEDPINLRCFDQKRRFGIDFMYPIERYVRGFTERFINDRDGNIVENPLFAGGRSRDLFMLTGIVGVPWQDIAFDPKTLASGYRPALQIDWGLLLGDPATSTPPFDPLMIESVEPRAGANPVTGAALAPPESTGALANPINGHERLIAQKDDLQYACVYSRPTPKDCSASADCECTDDNIVTNPVCQAPDGTYAGVQRFARALPGTRELTLLQRLGDKAVVASVCAEVTDDATKPTFGYKPAVDAMLRSLRLRLVQPQETEP